MQVTAKIEAAGMAKLKDTITRIVATTNRQVPNILKQASIFFTQSVIKLTPPSRSSTIKGIPKKYKTRPVVNSFQSSVNWYLYKTKDGQDKMFTSDRVIRDHGSLKRIKKAIQYWNKKQNRWGFLPFLGDRKSKALRIPNAGAAKAGWLGVYRKLGKSGDGASTGERNSRVTITKAYIELVNAIRYAYKIAPNSVFTAMGKTRKRLEHTYLRKLSNDIKTQFHRG